MSALESRIRQLEAKPGAGVDVEALSSTVSQQGSLLKEHGAAIADLIQSFNDVRAIASNADATETAAGKFEALVARHFPGFFSSHPAAQRADTPAT